jgi:hypothetical protein
VCVLAFLWWRFCGPITKLNAEIVAGTASEAKNPALRLGFGVSEGQDFFGPRIGKRKCVSWRFRVSKNGSGNRRDSVFRLLGPHALLVTLSFYGRLYVER